MLVSCSNCRVLAKKFGFTRGVQRFRCPSCGVTFSAFYAPRTTDGKMVRKSVEKFNQVVELLMSGETIRGTASIAGVSRGTVEHYKAQIDTSAVRCECGGTAGHRGWCASRLARSPARQRFLKRWGFGKDVAEPPLSTRVPFFCVGVLSRKTAASVRAAVPFIDGEWQPATDEEFQQIRNDVWKLKQSLGCSRCGHVSAYGCSRRCRRCVRIETLIKKMEGEIACAIPEIISEQMNSLIVQIRSVGRSPQARLLALLRRLESNGRAKTIRT